MLLGYGAKNCWCFKDWLDINLRLNEDVPKDISLGRDYSLLLGYEGANASGKTNALKVFAFIADFAKNSFSYSTESSILFDSFFNNNNPSEFYVEFMDTDGLEYRYEAVLHKDHVEKELLFLVKSTMEEIYFERTNNEITINKLYDNENKIILRNNASFISTLHQYGIQEINDVYDFFAKNIINVTYRGLRYEISMDIPLISKMYFHNQDALNFTKNLIQKFDTGISNITISYREDEKNNKIYFPIFLHENENTQYKLGIDSESTGTRALYINLLFYYQNLQSGGVLLLDEFDINLHPDILPHLIKLFTDSKSNPYNAQMIFTSVNPDNLDILGKYRSYLFEKDDGESFGYRLDEPDTNILKNDRKVSAPYRRHLLGGYPKIEA
ncbi:AAA family ATPase [Treponema vincentii]|uniref:AAA family ATPase n=1 Tax=Treponema vincentii TaxID=69710 RepID=UPI0020A519DE|nr:ATP-binding protein [Treponema vincentii]UTC45884.1 ATP-binding protein [Treponema vincentii]UTC48257.1 ATP-binding protein [Treponema vincentii]